MRLIILVAAATLGTLPLCIGAAAAQDQVKGQTPTQQQSIASSYRGMFVCERQAGSTDILHVPVDFAVRGGEVQFARPLFNLRGTRVLGSELGAGSVDPGGKVHVTSVWRYGGITVHGDYNGTLTPDEGTLSGTQSWRGPGGQARSRTCEIALVQTANAQPVTSK